MRMEHNHTEERVDESRELLTATAAVVNIKTIPELSKRQTQLHNPQLAAKRYH